MLEVEVETLAQTRMMMEPVEEVAVDTSQEVVEGEVVQAAVVMVGWEELLQQR